MKPSFLIRLPRTMSMLTYCGLLTACAGYAPKPLPTQVHWNNKADLHIDARTIALPALALSERYRRHLSTVTAI